MHTARRRSPHPSTLLPVSLLLLASVAAAREVRVPITLDVAYLRQGIVAQMYTGPGNTARVWDDGSGCNYLTLSDPQLDMRSAKFRLLSRGEGRVGTPIGEQCIVAVDWRGQLEIFEEAALAPASSVVRFRVTDSNLYGPDGKKPLAAGVLWDWVKAYVHPRLEAVTVDLHSPVDELRALLPLLLPREDEARIERILGSLALADVRPADAGAVVVLRFDVPDRTPATAPAPEPTLSAEELRRWEAAWQRWDAFLTFLVKRTAADAPSAPLEQALREVLLDARHDLLGALAPPHPGAPDPVRPLFLRTWERLAPVLRSVGTGLPAAQTLRYLSFVAAADALRAIDELGPDIGLEISADGLRRLARIVAPDTTEDPTEYTLAVDPQLRRLFGFGPPLPPADDNPEVDLSSWLFSAAWASIEPDRSIVARLNRWAPVRSDIDEYLPLARDLLRQTAAQTLAEGKLAPEFAEIYRWIVLTTAWQETCWRQFIRQGGQLKPIRSAVGSVGLMQVNQNVWRGIYDVPSLQKDIGYNAKAGSEILVHYLADYAVAKGEHTGTGNTDNLARATYSVYNGGPGHLRRYRNPKAPKSLRLIDEAFWTKYQAVKAGRELDVATCYGEQK